MSTFLCIGKNEDDPWDNGFLMHAGELIVAADDEQEAAETYFKRKPRATFVEVTKMSASKKFRRGAVAVEEKTDAEEEDLSC